MSQTSNPAQSQQLMKQALLELRELRSKVATMEVAKQEPIAIIGMGCRLPGGVTNPEQFWQLLKTGVDAITEVPRDRWDIEAYYDPDPLVPGKMASRYGGFVEASPYEFDPYFFGLSPREAATLDPQQRLLMEVSWEALEAAGQAPDQLEGSATGVFVGICTSDYSQILLRRGASEIDAYLATGNTHSVAAGRLSYFLGLRGPCLAVDTACSSSLVTLHLAVKSLRSGECNLALAGGVNRMLAPEATINFSKAHMLAPDGRCKTFDARADGYVRGEGCGMVALKRLSDAQADGDAILAVIRGSAINQDGRSSGLTVPNGPSQQRLILDALADGGLEPSQVSYIEAHGTGTALGDPIELGALTTVFGPQRSPEQPLWIGSVKTNIGHLEGAAGVAGVIKTVLALQHQEIPPHLHFQQPTDHLDWHHTPLQVPTSAQPWESEGSLRVAGVSSFAFSGTNAHIVLAQAPERVSESKPERSHHLFTASARSPEALQEIVERYQQYLATHPDSSLGDICGTTNQGRAQFEYRLGIVAGSLDELKTQLQAMSQGHLSPGIEQGVIADLPPKTAFMFTGQGSQYIDMGRELYETQPVFRAALDRCDKILQQYDIPLLNVLYGEAEEDVQNTLREEQSSTKFKIQNSEIRIHQTAYTQPALFALEYALAQLWQAWGVYPDVVMGHSVGEYVAACIAGVFSLEDGLKLIAERGRLMQALPQTGTMVAVMASEAQVQAIAEFDANDCTIAAINGSQNVVVSGSKTAIAALCETLNRKGIKTTPLTVSHAFHSPLMAPMVADFKAVAATVTYHPPQLDIVSNLTGQLVSEAAMATADYWCNHILQPVRFADSVQYLQEQKCSLLLEVGPKPVLTAMAHHCLASEASHTVSLLPSLRLGQSDWRMILLSLARLYCEGGAVDWAAVNQGFSYQRLPLPTYPFQRQWYGVETPEALPATSHASPVLRAIEQGNVQQLQNFLAPGTDLTVEQSALLQTFAEALIQKHQLTKPQPSLADWLYEIEWRVQPRAHAATPPKPTAGNWLIFSVQGSVGDALVAELAQSGNTVWRVYGGDDYQVLGDQTWQINPSQPEHFQKLLTAIHQAQPETITGILHLWSLVIPASESLTAKTLQQAQAWGSQSALYLVQALSKFAPASRPHIWWLTRGAVSVDQERPQVAQSPLWGLARVIGMEYPQYWGGLCDLPVQAASIDSAALLAEITDNQGEDHIVLRSEPSPNGVNAVAGLQRYVARLMPHAFQPAPAVQLRSEATYLITGGLGSLGRQVAQRLANLGAKHLVLVGRRAPSGPAQACIAQLEAQGVTVQVAQADIAQLDDTAAVMAQIDATLPPLAGVIHAAGVSTTVALADLDWEAATAVLQPKLEGTWNLHTLTLEKDLDFFVMFSSIASVWGSKGLGHYAAANHFLDSLAAYRKCLGLPATTINWGPWAEGGMVADESRAWLAQRGLEAVAPERGLAALEWLLANPITQLTVAGVDWPLFRRLYEASGSRPLVSELGEGTARSATSTKKERDAIWQELEGLPPEERLEQLTEHLQAEVGRVLGINDPAKLPRPQQGFFDMGMDSLMALELKSRLETSLAFELPATLLIEAPTLTVLAQYLAQQVLNWAETESVTEVAEEVSNEAAELAAMSQLSEAEVNQMLEQELGELESLLMED